MKYSTRLYLYFNRFSVKVRKGENAGLYRVSRLIALEARQLQKRRKGPSPRGEPPHAHAPLGLKDIRFDVRGFMAMIGPRKFRRSNFFDRPVPNIHEKGGMCVAAGIRRRYLAYYPERSFMWAAVKSLHSKGKIGKEFSVSLIRAL